MLKVIAPERETDTTDRQLSWFAERVEKGRKAPFVEIVSITPEIAKRLLESNDGNRPLSENLVNEIAGDIERGFWSLNGETIIVSKEGLLNDGQHRLEAVVRTGLPIQSAVMFGVAREARMTVDMGRQRSSGNFLAMQGASHYNHAASISRLLLFHSKGLVTCGGGGKYRYNPTKQEILDFYRRHKKEISAATTEALSSKFFVTSGVTPFAAAYVLLHRANAVECAVFFARLADGANLSMNDPILWLRSRMTTERKNRLSGAEKLEIILRHWNRWRAGSKVTRNIPREGSYPEISR